MKHRDSIIQALIEQIDDIAEDWATERDRYLSENRWLRAELSKARDQIVALDELRKGAENDLERLLTRHGLDSEKRTD